MKYTIITPDGKVEERIQRKEPDAKEVSEILGGYMELIHIKWRNGVVDAFVNEDAKRQNLPINLMATALWHNYHFPNPKGPYADLNKDPQGHINAFGDHIRGTMVMMTGI